MRNAEKQRKVRELLDKLRELLLEPEEGINEEPLSDIYVKTFGAKPGDLVAVTWLDASEVSGAPIPKEGHELETPVVTYGIFVALKTSEETGEKYAIIVKEILQLEPPEVHYNVIPQDMIYKVEVISPNAMPQQLLKRIRRTLRITPLRRLKRGRVEGAWWLRLV